MHAIRERTGRWLTTGPVLAICVAVLVVPTEAAPLADSSWDVVVLGQIDFCLVCQFGASPYVRYTQVLAGQVHRASSYM